MDAMTKRVAHPRTSLEKDGHRLEAVRDADA